MFANGCSCEKEPVKFQSRLILEQNTIDFGKVAVVTTSSITITIRNGGSAPLEISDISFDGVDKDKFSIFRVIPSEKDNDTKFDKIGTQSDKRKGTITVLYQPCPSYIESKTEWSKCSTGDHVAQMTIKANDPEKSHLIQITGKGVLPPRLVIACDQYEQKDGKIYLQGPKPECVFMKFKPAVFGQEIVRQKLYLYNIPRTDDPDETADLYISSIEFLAKELIEQKTYTGKELGLSVISPTGNILIEPGDSQQKRVEVILEYTGLIGGDFSASRNDGEGIKIFGNLVEEEDEDLKKDFPVFSDDTGSKYRNAGMLLSATAPLCNFTTEMILGDVFPNCHDPIVHTFTFRNSGNADLKITDILIENDEENEFSIETSIPIEPQSPHTFLAFSGETMTATLTYAPKHGSNDEDIVTLKFVAENYTCPEGKITASSLPRIVLDTSHIYIPNTGGIQTGTATITNLLCGDLNIKELNFTGPQGNTDWVSIPDFSVQGASLPLTITGESNFPLKIIYDNKDDNQQDLVELHIISDDPSTSDYTITVLAESTPCFAPNPDLIIETQPSSRIVDSEIVLDASGSGDPNQNGSITSYQFELVFAPSDSIMTTSDLNIVGPKVSFIPDVEGTYVIQLTATNSCGRTANVQEKVKVGLK